MATNISDPKWGVNNAWRKLSPRQRAACPYTSKDALTLLSRQFPHALLRNPAVPLLLLEDPSWEAPRFARRFIACQRFSLKQLIGIREDWILYAGEGHGLARYGRAYVHEGGIGLGDGYGWPALDGSGRGRSPASPGAGVGILARKPTSAILGE